MTASGNLAIFDLDNTLTKGDTLVPWLVALAGRRRFLMAAAGAGLARVRARPLADRRTVFKEALQIPLLAGVTVARADQAAQAVAPRSGKTSRPRHSMIIWPKGIR